MLEASNNSHHEVPVHPGLSIFSKGQKSRIYLHPPLNGILGISFVIFSRLVFDAGGIGLTSDSTHTFTHETIRATYAFLGHLASKFHPARFDEVD